MAKRRGNLVLVGLCVLVISVVVAYVEIPPLWRQGSRKEVWIYGSLMLLGNAMVTLKGLNKPLPNPGEWAAFVLMPLTKLLMHIGYMKP
ncbi:hypothetical protein GC096_35310 [Paenibacillus sp. LMG 31461]|uniref:Uncharacterized protein n=1 Tax=Paenibacillus plantarum TaxID=2654975 RepID=A0ABX1XN91_9BACL|nr:hypothetical protein [Paenibacillus plantarum]NOU69289.1 hypothetical protein [Paenibacillus plantarum]